MKHVGNDIVDLDAPGAENKSRNLRFMKKVLTADEIDRVTASCRPDAALWGIWAAKETAYKVLSKSFPDAAFSPLKYRLAIHHPAVKPGESQEGIVSTPHGPVAVKIFFGLGYVHCIGNRGDVVDVQNIMHGHGRTRLHGDKDAPVSRLESAAVRNLALAHVARFLNKSAAEMEIRGHVLAGRTRPPALFFKGEKEPIDISLSHDGRFVAYAFCGQAK
jgi:hypothetical protein